MTWDDDLRGAAGELGNRLERGHPGPARRRKVRWTAPVAVALALALGITFTRPDDPAAAIRAQYAGNVDLKIDDPELRREFEAALAQVDRAIALAEDAVRRSPRNADFVELCHLAHRARMRLIQAYSHGG
jgi:hypothetical protein